VVVTPRHAVVEHPKVEDRALLERRRWRRRVLGLLMRNSFVSSKTLLRGWLSTSALGLLSAIPLIGHLLAPRTYARLRHWLNKEFLPEPRTELTFMRDTAPTGDAMRGLLMDFAPEEKTESVASVLEPAGLTRGFARLVVVLGHGSTSLNNPHESAHDCGRTKITIDEWFERRQRELWSTLDEWENIERTPAARRCSAKPVSRARGVRSAYIKGHRSGSKGRHRAMEQQVGRYRILGQVGRGSMGVVYLAEDPVLSRQVAIKIVDVAVDDESRKEFLRHRLLRDARAAAALSHPNIVTVHDVLEQGGKAHVVMEYIAGESLAARLKRTVMPDLGFTLRVLREMAAALDYTHGRGIVHRDIKPGNVMIEVEGTVKIMDFGIARIHEGSGSTAAGMVMGTIEYMAPEQLNGGQLDGSADQFSLASTAYRMLSGSTLFGQHSFAALAYKIANETPPPVTSRNAALPVAVDDVLAKALSKIPSERFASCGEFVQALERAFAVTVRVDEEVTRVGSALTKPMRRQFSGIALATRITSAFRAGATFVMAVVRRGAFGSPGFRHRMRFGVLAIVILAISGLIVWRWLAANSAQKTAMQAYDRAWELTNHSRDAEAIPLLNKAIGIRPNLTEALMARGRALLHLHQTEAAINDFSAVIRIDPQNEWAYYSRAECNAARERYDLALADYNRALHLNPKNQFALGGRGVVFLKQKNYAKAIDDLTEATRINPRWDFAYHKRSEAKEAIGDTAGAKADLDKAFSLDSQPPR
jgi:tetratricopeptide (TPR) repeat protein